MHSLSSDRISPETLVVPNQPTRPSDFIIMTSNLANQSLKDQFLRWCQDMEAKQKEHARRIAELQSRADHLQHENDRLRTRLKGERIEKARGSSHLVSLVKQNKGKEPIRPEDSDAAADDELSSDSSPLSDLPPPKNNRPPPRSSWSVSSMPRRVRREFSRERRKSEHAPENILAWLGGAQQSLPFGYPAFGVAPVASTYCCPGS